MKDSVFFYNLRGFGFKEFLSEKENWKSKDLLKEIASEKEIWNHETFLYHATQSMCISLTINQKRSLCEPQRKKLLHIISDSGGQSNLHR